VPASVGNERLQRDAAKIKEEIFFIGFIPFP